MDEIVKSIKAFLYDRTVSPLFGAYACAWSLWNYQVILAIFDGDATLEQKKSFIDNYFGPVLYFFGDQTYYVWGQITNGLLGPVLLTLIYLYIYLKFAKPVYEYSLEKQKELSDIKQKNENLRLLTIEESRSIIKEIEQLRLKADEDTKRYRERIANLTETINALESNQNSTQPSITSEQLPENMKEKLNLEELASLVNPRVQLLPKGEFEFSELFNNQEWSELSESAKKEYGKLFKKIVERGDFTDTSLRKKGSSNQLIYIKDDVDSSEILSYRNTLATNINLERLKNSETDDSINATLAKIAAYLRKSNISEDMLGIFIVLIQLGDAIGTQDLFRRFTKTLTRIEFDHIVNKLEHIRVIGRDNNYKIILSDTGKEIAVESGLISLLKKLSK